MVLCSCGSATEITTSWTAANPGRRFYCCTKQGVNCGFVAWVDPPMCNRAVAIIPGLLRSMNKLELEATRSRDKANTSVLDFMLSISCIQENWLVKIGFNESG
ncbi:hypothetical protein SSX86_031792 [Deinandra increscens subsp. villosa]|uniref:GRF-type domain-containing protein n=1 Tax=Deinandra increscens subsp. villosa TaxID=3103831 RepID=A0AAP0C3W7_9ASTR